MNRKTRNRKRNQRAARKRLFAADAPKAVRFYSGIDEVAIECAGGDKAPTFSISPAYNGGALQVKGFPYPVVVDLQSATFEKSSLKVNRDHEGNRPLGHTDAGQMEINASGPRMGIHLGGQLSVPGKDRDEVIEAAQNNFPWEASIEATFPRSAPIPSGKSVTVNGKVFQGPVFVAKNAKIYGVAILSRGADRNTQVRIAAELVSGEEPEMNKELREFLEAKGLDVSNSTPAQLLAALADKSGEDGGTRDWADLQARFEKEIGATFDKQRKDLVSEQLRLSEISTICAGFDGTPTIEIGEGDDKKTVSLHAHAIETGMTAETVRLQAKLWDLGRKSGGGGNGGSSRRFSQEQLVNQHEILEASMAMSHFNVSEETLASTYGDRAERVMNEATKLANRSHSLHSLMNMVIHAAGMSYSGSFKSMDYWAKYHEAQEILLASGTSTLSLPNMFENVLNKTLLDSFEKVSTVWQMVCHIASNNDFRATSRVRLTEKGGFRRVGKDGEIKHVGMTDSKRTNQVDTFGAMLSLTRQDIINDDLGGLQTATAMLGEMAANRIEEEVWVTFLAAVAAGSFFSTGNKNYISGAATALGPKAVADARDKFINRVNSNNKPIAIGPSILVHGVPDHSMADSLYNDQMFDLGQASANSKTPVRHRNEHYRKYMPVESVYLSNTDIKDSDGDAITGQTQTGWGLFAAPRQSLAIMEVAFLNGVRTPTTATSDMVFNKLGMEYRAHHDFGVAMGDEEAGVWSKGAA